ncbi:bactericidal permeability-increasing protein [Stigmatopora nigra]
MFLKWVILVLPLIYCSCGQNPAMQVVLNDKGLQYGRHVVAGWIQDKLEHGTLPDISGKINLGFLFNIQYTISGVTVRKCDFPEPSVEFYQATSGLKMSIIGLNVALAGDWKANCRFIHENGSFDMALFGVDLISTVKLGMDTDGHMSLTSVNCIAQTGDVDLRFHGETSWFQRLLEGRIKDHLTKQLPTTICSAVEEVIASLENHLKDMNVNFPLNEDVTLDLPLIDQPVVHMKNLHLGLKGEIHSNTCPRDPPFVAQAFSVLQRPGYMLSVGLSDFTLNSASFSYYSSNLLQVFINDSMIPPSFPVRLNTSSMGPFIPQLPKMFPDLLMLLHIHATDIPMFSFRSGAVVLSAKGAVEAFAIQGTALTPLFKVCVNSNFKGKARVDVGRLKGSVTMHNFSMNLGESEIGPFKTDALENMAVMLMQIAILPQLNEKLAVGFALPRTAHAQLVNSLLTVEEGFVAFSSDAQLVTKDAMFR